MHNLTEEKRGSGENALKADSHSSKGLPNERTASDSSFAFLTEKRKKAAKTLSAYDLDIVKHRIKGWTEHAALTMRTRADSFTMTAKISLSHMGEQLNRMTGYEEIEALKKQVGEQEAKIYTTREVARQAKIAYEQAMVQRSKSQREVNDLLQRKSMWTKEDVGRFTSIVQQDHLYEQEETRAKVAVDEVEDAVEREFSKLLQTILARYHEEQVWSDKIRSASTYGSLGALGLNLLVFLVAIILVEPWKRRRLAQTFEEKVVTLSKENALVVRENMQQIEAQLAAQRHLLAGLIETQKASQTDDKPILSPISEVEGRKDAAILEGIMNSTFSYLEATTRKQWEVTIVGTGAFLVGVAGFILLR